MTDIILYKGFYAFPRKAEELKASFIIDGIRIADDVSILTQVIRPDIMDRRDFGTDDTRSGLEFDVVHAYDKLGAVNDVMLRKRRDQVGFVVRFAAPYSRSYVDGEDIIYPAFKDGLSLDPLRRYYGRAMAKYVLRARGKSMDDQKVAIADIACHDPKVLSAHSRNKFMITVGPRMYKSAFIVKTPIYPRDILGIEDIVGA